MGFVDGKKYVNITWLFLINQILKLLLGSFGSVLEVNSDLDGGLNLLLMSICNAEMYSRMNDEP